MLLEVKDLQAHYGDSHVLQGVSLHVPEGSVVVLLGRNGVGKTTLVHTIAGFVSASGGEVLLQGHSLNKLTPERIASYGVALVPQGRRVFPSLRVGENLTVAAVRTRGATNAWDIAKACAHFPILGTRWRQLAGKMSGGEQQMLSTARALVRNAHLILMDEPSEGLAPFMVEQLAEAIKQSRNDGKGVLLVEQKLGFALKMADYVYIMSRGRVVYEGTPQQLNGDKETKARLLGV